VSIAGDSQPIGEGSVVYFHDLHLDTARRVSATPVFGDVYRYEVMGKSRPMIVLSEVERKGKGPKWYRVLRLSTKISENKRKLGYEKLGQILESDKESYFDTTPYWYPSNLVDGCEKKRIDRQGLDAIYKTVAMRVLAAWPA